MTPSISVVVPAYNGVTRYLDRAIESVLAQTVHPTEIIVSDDASTDGTAQLVAGYPAVRYLRRPTNGGQAAARNEGAHAAHGEFLAFLDQDDLWERTFLEEMSAILIQHRDAAVAHADGYQVTEHNAILHYDGAMKSLRSVTQLLRGNHDVATSGSLFRKACFEAIGGYDEELTIWEDIDLAIRLYRRFPIVHVPKALYRHRIYAHNASRDIPSERALLGRRRFLEKHQPSCVPGSPEAEALRRDWAQYYADLGKHHLRNGNRREGRRALWRSLQSFPFQRKAALRLLGSYVKR